MPACTGGLSCRGDSCSCVEALHGRTYLRTDGTVFVDLAGNAGVVVAGAMMDPLDDIVQIFDGQFHGCALRADGTVYLDDVEALVRAGQNDRSITDGDPRVLAHGVMGAVSSFSNSWRSGLLDVTADELAVQVSDWVSRAVRA